MSEKYLSSFTAKAINLFLLTQLFLLWGCPDSQKNLNRLQFASSPYLRDHADNPVEWFEWGDEALKKAEKENKPLIVSIGYAACHWCHVMEEESFMDTAVARVMNENFICIKVDREEHPDIDKVYMDALQHLSGNAGWPLNAFALPDGKPFFAGTYYAKNDWMGLLQNVANAYRTKHKLVVMQAQALHNGMNTEILELTDTSSLHNQAMASYYPALYDSIIKVADTINGGLNGTPKFPTPAFSEMLLQHHYITGNKQALEIAMHTLNAMALSGMYDQVGGGFARYATDSNWRVPHFEKMLYDNGLMVSLYAHAYQLTKNELYKTIISETIDFVEKTLAAPGGGYFSSVNADTKDGEGKFYSWNKSEFLSAIHHDSLMLAYYHITSPGNWKQEDNILYATQTPIDFARDKNISPVQFIRQLQLAKKRLMEERHKRTGPSVDTKIITAWNSMMIKGYADAYAATGIEEYLLKALNGARFLESQLLSVDGNLPRICNDGQAKIPGFLDDYAWTASAFIRLYEVSFEIRWLDLAKKLTDYTIKNFSHPAEDIFYYTALSETKLMRKTPIADDDLPSANAIMAESLYRLGNFYQDTLYSNLSAGMCLVVMKRVKALPRYHIQSCKLIGLMSVKPYEVAIIGKEALDKNKVLQQNYLPTSIFMGSTQVENLPLLKNKLIAGKTFIYVCTERMCKRPEVEPDSAMNQIKRLTNYTMIRPH